MDAVQRFEQLLAQGKDNALLRFSLGMQYLNASDAARAEEHLRKALAMDGSYSAAWKLLGKALEQQQRGEEAMQAYRAGIAAAEQRGDKQAAKEMGVFLKRLEKRAAGGA
jgi:Tfp pilus assembly protein PilF